ncbi:FAD/NAD(P)-binding domain-containing protein [Ceraceosorus guamensis]|uniref:FAD/NAD(P)-binding domain-containing protein n=1 Tax=Ceraceosorus guamensis TaxID=1522189 RepID=A0A316W1G9_9BASI|nr:FAD/NAD(P)-binding domain-containing protein [Ceraceosorus guamensis]PWN42411.1 FAD/NAD(P)-binding domain-containing protein [Ceraceosorus guamensis]
MKVCIVGSGFSGLSTASVLKYFGHDVTIYEAATSAGGVWSDSRRYPGLTTQNTKDTYALSSLPMPKHYPEWPTGEQVCEYLHAYADQHDLKSRMRLGTRVVETRRLKRSTAELVDHQVEGGLAPVKWQVVDQHGQAEDFDHIVICTGTFDQPHLPNLKGKEEFEANGGQVLHSSQVHDSKTLKGKKVVVLGYGKSSHDLAYAASLAPAASVTLVAKRLLHKLPRKLGGVLPYKYLLLTRLGEALFPYIRITNPFEKALHHGPLRWLREAMLGSISSLVRFQLGLGSLGLVPPTPFEEIACAKISLATPHFFSSVKRGDIDVKAPYRIQRLAKGTITIYPISSERSSKADDSNPTRPVADGVESKASAGASETTLDADVIICGTGWEQNAPTFLPQDVQESLLDDSGNWVLYRRVLPCSPLASGITFNGFSSSLFCPTSSEAVALWIAAYLSQGRRMLPSSNLSREAQLDILRTKAELDLEWLGERSGGHHARGTNVVPFSLHTIDELLADAGVGLSLWNRLKEWLLPINPSAYKDLAPRLRQRLESLQAPEQGKKTI